MKEGISETLVTFETAKLAKECGFDELCREYYSEDGEGDSFWYYAGDGTGWDKNSTIIENDDYCYDCVCTAPTQSLLQTWLRNRKILVEVFPVDDWIHWGYRITMEDSMAPMFVAKMSDKEEWSTYESALEVALQEGLKLMK